MHEVLRYLKVDGKIHDKGRVVDLSVLSKKEVSQLEKKRFVEKIVGNPSEEVQQSEENKEVNNDEKEEDPPTDEEVKAELLEKLNHGIVVKELKLLGADFKANASFEKLVDLIMENEEHENHFLDYIDDNGL